MAQQTTHNANLTASRQLGQQPISYLRHLLTHPAARLGRVWPSVGVAAAFSIGVPENGSIAAKGESGVLVPTNLAIVLCNKMELNKDDDCRYVGFLGRHHPTDRPTYPSTCAPCDWGLEGGCMIAAMSLPSASSAPCVNRALYEARVTPSCTVLSPTRSRHPARSVTNKNSRNASTTACNVSNLSACLVIAYRNR